MKPMKKQQLDLWDSEKIKILRENYGETQEEFAPMLGVSVPTLRMWEQGKGRPAGSAQKLLKFAKLGLDDPKIRKLLEE